MRSPGRTALVALVCVGLLAGCTRAPTRNVTLVEPPQAWPVYSESTQGFSRALLTLPAGDLEVELVDQPTERERGLAYRDELGSEGMLFIFESTAPQPFWMKGMRFALDIVWLREGRVVFVEQNVPPAAADDANPPTVGPSEPVDAVLEVAAGRASQLGLQVGATVDIRELRK